MSAATPASLKYWSVLNTHGDALLKSVEDDWSALLSNKKAKEAAYLTFLSEHSAFFFSHAVQHQYFSIAELRLGTDYRADFVVPADNFSYGLQYCLIEIESPHTPPFTKKRVASARLNAAMQQIRDWRTWLRANRSSAHKLFPSSAWIMDSQPVFTYKIVIGRRDDKERHLDKVMEYAAEINAEIRSFDWLTEMLNVRSKRFRTSMLGALSPEIKAMPDTVKNAIVNPFARSLTEKDWKDLVRGTNYKMTHFLSTLGDGLAEALCSNSRESQFKKIWTKLPAATRKKIESSFNSYSGD